MLHTCQIGGCRVFLGSIVFIGVKVFRCSQGKILLISSYEIKFSLHIFNHFREFPKNGKRKRIDKASQSSTSHPNELQSPVYGRDTMSPYYGHDTEFHNYGSKRQDVHSDFFGSDMLISDSRSLAKADKIFLTHSSMKGSETRLSRHLSDLEQSDLPVLKVRHRGVNSETNTDENTETAKPKPHCP